MSRFFILGTLLLAVLPAPYASTAGAQAAGGQPPAAPAPATPALDFSGTIFGNYQYRTDSAARAQTGGRNPNKFDVERVYLTFRMPAGDRASIRVTTDIFQNPSVGYYAGWVVRLKFGYLQYDLLKNIGGHAGFDASARIGMLQTVVVDHLESFWPRWLGATDAERHGFFTSSDMGVSGLITLPDKLGEVYGTITNGPGYTAPETDRFKDLALRVTITPFGARDGLLRTLAITPWVYDGLTASRYATAGPGEVGPVTEGVTRDRWGLFVGLKDPRLTAGVHYAHRIEGFEPPGRNTPAAPRTVADSTGALTSAFVIARPWRWTSGPTTRTLGVVARWDQLERNTAFSGHNRFVTAGLVFEPNTRTALSLDYQSLTPTDYAPHQAPIVGTTTWYLHWTGNF